jgi:fructose-bisphosphate aldolase class I
LSDFISGAILFDETIHQSTKEGVAFLQIIKSAGIIPGIKVDKGLVDMAGRPLEKITEGLDGLRGRLAEYVAYGLHFAKWRAVLNPNAELPSESAIEANAHALARYAALCQESSMVPIVELEVLMDGSETLERCALVTEKALYEVFNQLIRQGVALEHLILKTNMILPGLNCSRQVSADQIAQASVQVLLRAVPAAVPGVAFLSGGQTGEAASTRLNLMNERYGGDVPWKLTFSFSRALQYPALQVWAGREKNKIAAQRMLLLRAKCNAAASTGTYLNEMEKHQLA